MAIIIVGLGPGTGRLLTREAWGVLSSADVIYLRTFRHPAVADLPAQAKLVGFDKFYESANDFDEVYERITNEVLKLAKESSPSSSDIIYAVPGHPLIGEATVTRILEVSEEEGVPVTIVDGMSFLEPTLSALGVDGLEGLQLFDAIEVGGYNHPPLNTDRPLVLGQVYSRSIANELKLALMAHYPDEHEVILVHAAGTERRYVESVPLYGIDRSEHLAHLSSLYVPPLPNASTLPSLANTVAYLRGPDGCPWDQEQTRQSLRADFMEEVGEALAAMDNDDAVALEEELGDVLYHLVMQAQIAAEMDEFKLSDVIAGIDGKLKFRHPHVWGEVSVADSEEVVRNWEELKAQEKQGDHENSLLDDIPENLPALARSKRIQRRVKGVGFDWPTIDGVIAKVYEEFAEVEAAGSLGEQAMEMGDVLFAVVNWARWLGIDAEIALRDANSRFDRRFRRMENMAAERALELKHLEVNDLDILWEEAKEIELRSVESCFLDEDSGEAA
jgi:tetrapyrrole methylase family protein/MazG family protein